MFSGRHRWTRRGTSQTAYGVCRTGWRTVSGVCQGYLVFVPDALPLACDALVLDSQALSSIRPGREYEVAMSTAEHRPKSSDRVLTFKAHTSL